MTQALRLWPLLTATHRYDKTISTLQPGAWRNHRSAHPGLPDRNPERPHPVRRGLRPQQDQHPQSCASATTTQTASLSARPRCDEGQRIPHHLARLGLTPADVDVIFIGHLHFDHAGGLKESAPLRLRR